MKNPTYLQGVLEAEEQYNVLKCKRQLWSWFEKEVSLTVDDYRWSDWREGAYFYICHIEKNSIGLRKIEGEV
ncbi:hypothetical protein NVP1101O_140 [Vibrio phage 1.101.O._10N.261.45.C6]|nr:hypothetical protein NVP1101O_140 [Vibrio phage 1.101.O._10N.261.45.C6]